MKLDKRAKAGSSGTKAGFAVVQRQAGQWYKGRQQWYKGRQQWHKGRLGSGTKAGWAVAQRQAGRQQWYKGRQAGSSGTKAGRQAAVVQGLFSLDLY